MEAVNTPWVRLKGKGDEHIHKMLSFKTAHQLSQGSPWDSKKSKIRPVTTKSHGNKRNEEKREKAQDCQGVDQDSSRSVKNIERDTPGSPRGGSEEEEKDKMDNREGERRGHERSSSIILEKTGQIKQHCLNNETPVEPPFRLISIRAAWFLEKSI